MSTETTATTATTVVEESATIKAAKGLAKLIAVVIVLAVALFGDVMYIIEMQKVFPSGGLLLIFCYLGAFTSFLAIGYLLLGKSVTFRPGGQMIAAWVVFAMELLIIALNVILVFNNDRSGMLGLWAYLSPATPVLHMLGVALIYFLDPELIEKHKDMEMQARLNDETRKYKHELALAALRVRQRHLEYTVAGLEDAINSPESQAHIKAHAYHMNAQLLSQLSGKTYSALPAGPDTDELGVVESDRRASVKKVGRKRSEAESNEIRRHYREHGEWPSYLTEDEQEWYGQNLDDVARYGR